MRKVRPLTHQQGKMLATGLHRALVQQPARRNKRDPVLKRVECAPVKASARRDLGRVGAKLSKNTGNLRQRSRAVARFLVFGSIKLLCRDIVAAGFGATSEAIHCHDSLPSLSRIVEPIVLNCQSFRRELASQPSCKRETVVLMWLTG